MPNDMVTIKIKMPARIPHGRKSSVLKGIIDGLKARMGKGTTKQSHVPEGHKEAIQIGKDIAEQIEAAVEKRFAREKKRSDGQLA